MIYTNNYGLPHDNLRHAQADAIGKILNLHSSGGGVVFLGMPVGTGKSAVAAALGSVDSVTVFTSSLALLIQYEEKYQFSAIRGRQWYPCVYDKKIQSWNGNYPPTALDCHFSKMYDCPSASTCPYLNAKAVALSANKSVMTYRYGVLSRSVARRNGFLVFDECDMAAKEISANSEILFTRESLSQWNMPLYPNLKTGELENRDTIIDWLLRCEKSLPQLDPTSVFDMTQMSVVEKRKTRLTRTAEAIHTGDWFIETNQEHIRLKPLTAKTLARQSYQNKKTIVLMSATIGNPEPIAGQLALGEYSHIEYPHPTPIENRPVYKVQKAPSMSYTEDGLDHKKYKYQSDLIWLAIKKMPQEWRGIVLTSSIAKANYLYDTLSPRLKNHTIITGNSAPLIEQFYQDASSSLIAIGYLQGWSHGVNLEGDLGRYSIIACVPFPSESDPYVKAMRSYDRHFYEYLIYSTIVQASGRVTRGDKDENGNYTTNHAYLVDSRAWSYRALSYYPDWYTESLIFS